MRADRTMRRQFPATRRKPERFGCQRPDRTNVDHVAGQFGIDVFIQESRDLFTVTPVDHTEFHQATDLFAETDTTGALDTAAHFLHGNQRPGIFYENNAFFPGKTGF